MQKLLLHGTHSCRWFADKTKRHKYLGRSLVFKARTYDKEFVEDRPYLIAILDLSCHRSIAKCSRMLYGHSNKGTAYQGKGFFNNFRHVAGVIYTTDEDGHTFFRSAVARNPVEEGLFACISALKEPP